MCLASDANLLVVTTGSVAPKCEARVRLLRACTQAAYFANARACKKLEVLALKQSNASWTPLAAVSKHRAYSTYWESSRY